MEKALAWNQQRVSTTKSLNIAIQGCCHGELNKIYSVINEINTKTVSNIDLLICCGDFQAIKSSSDLTHMSCPPAKLVMKDFHEYYNGQKLAPILTIFIGGNHENSHLLHTLYHGGWVAPNIFYLGSSGVVWVDNIRIGGISGIYKAYNYNKGHYEKLPLTENSKRSVYHIRRFEIEKLNLLKQPIHIMLSHDWPCGIDQHGDWKTLIRAKQHFKNEIMAGELGNPPAMQLLKKLKPSYWFSAHLHVKFSAIVQHDSGETTRFLALDKVAPNRSYIQFLNIDSLHPENYKLIDLSLREADDEKQNRSTPRIYFDKEWLCILKENQAQIPLSFNNSEFTIRSPSEATYKWIEERSSNTLDEMQHADGYIPQVKDPLFGRIPWPDWHHLPYKDPELQRKAFLEFLELSEWAEPKQESNVFQWIGKGEMPRLASQSVSHPLDGTVATNTSKKPNAEEIAIDF